MKLLTRLIRQASGVVSRDVLDSATFDKVLLAQGAVAASHVRSVANVATLADVEFRIFSQWGEDGIIEWLVHHNGSMPETFVEFGVEDYREANTRFLLASRNWRGLVMDGSDGHIARTRAGELAWRHDLTASAAFITRDNINALITGAGFKGDTGILSVDIDGNDYWVWQAIEAIRPHIVITEYNAVFGDVAPLTIPYDAGFVRKAGHVSNLYYGASIMALDGLATAKGYTLLGTNRAGSNAFFIRNDRLPRFSGRIADTRPRPSRFKESRNEQGRLTHVTGAERAQVIGACPLVNVATGTTAPLATLGDLYSPRWLALMQGSDPGTPAEGAPV